MNTLTPNRILQEGDEFLDPKGKWKAVPKTDWGMLVQYVPYKEVRRPSEDLAKASNTKAEQSTTAPKATAKAEAEPVPASGVSPAGGESLTAQDDRAADHAKRLISDEEEKETTRAALSAVHKLAKAREALPDIAEVERRLDATSTDPTGILKLPFPEGAPYTIWIGRNGTFRSRGIDMRVVEELDEKNNKIQIRPAGIRGLAKNALIEFPASVIPQIVDWLLRMQTK